eukprot:Tamp_10711.p2 GENE.Tamp_10711~~Tamp_10711.p2  ORF type:complete len:123 (+),score=5.93 Tamp_10711:480-848(+)
MDGPVLVLRVPFCHTVTLLLVVMIPDLIQVQGNLYSPSSVQSFGLILYQTPFLTMECGTKNRRGNPSRKGPVCAPPSPSVNMKELTIGEDAHNKTDLQAILTPIATMLPPGNMFITTDLVGL